MSVIGPPDEGFFKSFFSTPSAFHSVIMTDPDKPPQAIGVEVKEEEENAVDNSSFTADKVKVAAPSIHKSNPAAPKPKSKASSSSGTPQHKPEPKRSTETTSSSSSSSTAPQPAEPEEDPSSLQDQFENFYLLFCLFDM